MSYPDTFELTEDHLKLVRNLNIRWEDYMYDGAPGVDAKRPFGNSDWWNDIAEHLGWWIPDEDEMSASEFEDQDEILRERATKIFRELALALLIVCQNAGRAVEPGIYENVYRFKPYGAEYRFKSKEAYEPA